MAFDERQKQRVLEYLTKFDCHPLSGRIRLGFNATGDPAAYDAA